ncbi:MAG: GNAT family N-acetyltransferase [Streptococcaceae bacterium]|jgi:RimJ/RimL family protein N-acetyltransferase|nr:GNAT family N-acetyltransferase [Streptococcaceae bacterium]
MQIFLRNWETTDAPRLYELAKSEKVALLTGFSPHESIEKSGKIIQTILHKKGHYAIVLKQTNEIIGNIGIEEISPEKEDEHWKSGELELGFWLGEAYWGQGYMKEALEVALDKVFREHNAKKVWCAYQEENKQSQKFQEKAGFVYHHTKEMQWNEALGYFYSLVVNVMTKEIYEEVRSVY